MENFVTSRESSEFDRSFNSTSNTGLFLKTGLEISKLYFNSMDMQTSDKYHDFSNNLIKNFFNIF